MGHDGIADSDRRLRSTRPVDFIEAGRLSHEQRNGTGLSQRAAVKLDKADLHNYLIIEAGDGPGGIWY